MLELRVERLDDPAGARFERDVLAEYEVLYADDVEADAADPAFDDQDAADPDAMTPPRGSFFVAYLDGEPVACGGFRPYEGDTAEIKRMYVVPEQRGRGWSRVVLAAIEDAALAVGYTRLRLETGTRQPAALHLYTSSGYEPIERYGVYKAYESSRCFEKRLGPTGK